VKLSVVGKTSISVFVLYFAAVSAPALAHSGPVVWIAPSLHRVGMTDPAGSGTEVNLASARSGYQSFQIVVTGASNALSNVNVKVSDLEGPRGALIPQNSFTLYREKYVHVTASSPNWGGSNKPLGAGWYADALIPFTDPNTGKPLSGANL
jgi:hypothetical protein